MYPHLFLLSFSNNIITLLMLVCTVVAGFTRIQNMIIKTLIARWCHQDAVEANLSKLIKACWVCLFVLLLQTIYIIWTKYTFKYHLPWKVKVPHAMCTNGLYVRSWTVTCKSVLISRQTFPLLFIWKDMVSLISKYLGFSIHHTASSYQC